MSAYKLIKLAGIGAIGVMLGGIVAAPLAATTSLVPSVQLNGPVKTFLSNCVANGVPNFQIVVGTNGALASDTVTAAWILGALEQHLYTTTTVNNTISISPNEIKNKVNVTVTNKKVKLEVGKYTTEYNESFTLTPSNTTTMNFTILNNTTVDGIKYYETATLKNVKMEIYGVNSTVVQIPAEGLVYTYRLYNATNNTTKLNLTDLLNNTLTLFGKGLTVYNVSDGKIYLRQEVNKTTIEKGEQVSLEQYGAPYDIELKDIAEEWTTNGTRVIIVDVINAKTGALVEEITDTPANVAETINEKYLKDYNVEIDITNVVKSGTTETAYADLVVIKNEFNLTADNATHDLPDAFAKFLGLEEGKWEYKIINEPNPEIQLIYKDQINITPSNKPVQLPGGLTLYVTQPKTTTYYTAQVTVGSYVKKITSYTPTTYLNTSDYTEFETTMTAIVNALQEQLNDTYGAGNVVLSVNTYNASSNSLIEYVATVTAKDSKGETIIDNQTLLVYTNTSGITTHLVYGKTDNFGLIISVNPTAVGVNLSELTFNVSGVDFTEVKNNALSGFDAINATNAWNVTYTPAVDIESGDFLLNISITNSTDKVDARIVYNVSSGLIAVYNGTDEILGYTNLLPKVVLTPYPKTESGVVNYNKLVVIAPDTIPVVKVAREAKRILESAQTYVLGEGQNISVGDTTVEVQAITEDVNVNVASGINISYNTTKVNAPSLTAAQLENLVTTDEQWLSEASAGTAKPYVITVGSRLVNNLTEAVVCGNQGVPSVEVPCRNGEANNPCGCALNFTAANASAMITVAQYTVNGNEYHVLIVAGSRAQDTLAAGEQLVQLIQSMNKE